MARRAIADRILTEAFFALLRSGLHERPLAAVEQEIVSGLSTAQWKALFLLSRQQTVSGLIFRALDHLPPGLTIPDEVELGLVAEADRIERDNRHKAAVSERLLARFKQQGLSPRVMKGSAVAVFYAYPTLRESGDIDFFFPPAELEQARMCLTATVTTPDGSVCSREEGVDIDLHDRYFDLHCAARKLPEPGTPEATLLMLSAHILKHAIGTGIGIRQFCDLAAAWLALEGTFDPAALKALFRRTGTLRWNRLLFSFLADRLDLPDTLFTAGRISSEPLLRIVLEGGNFGHYAAVRSVALQAGSHRRKRNTLARFLHRLPFSLRYAPRETFATILHLAAGNLRKIR